MHEYNLPHDSLNSEIICIHKISRHYSVSHSIECYTSSFFIYFNSKLYYLLKAKLSVSCLHFILSRSFYSSIYVSISIEFFYVAMNHVVIIIASGGQTTWPSGNVARSATGRSGIQNPDKPKNL